MQCKLCKRDIDSGISEKFCARCEKIKGDILCDIEMQLGQA